MSHETPHYGTPESAVGAGPVGSGESDPARAAAIKMVKRKREFGKQVFTYVAVNALLWVIWLVGGLSGAGWLPWPIFPLVGWGIGIAFTWYSLYGGGPGPITEEEIQRELRRRTG